MNDAPVPGDSLLSLAAPQSDGQVGAGRNVAERAAPRIEGLGGLRYDRSRKGQVDDLAYRRRRRG